MRRDGHDVVARHHQRLARSGAMLAAFLEHVGETRPLLRALVLPPELALAVAPAAIGHDRGNPLIHARGIDRDRTAEARSDDGNARRVDARLPRQKGQRAAGVLDLLEADHASRLAFALAAAPHVKAERDIAELVEHLAGLAYVERALVATKAVQDHECTAALVGANILRHAQLPGEAQTGGRNAYGCFDH